MFDCGCHDNDTSDAPNMAFFVHSPRKPTTTQKNSGGFKNLFPTLLHFFKKSLLILFKLGIFVFSFIIVKRKQSNLKQQIENQSSIWI